MTVRQNLLLVARRLGSLLDRAVFVGGATAELLIVERSSGPVRPTDDVDIVIPVASRLEYLRDITELLRKAGFKPDMRDGAPVCRFIVDDVTVDVMPTDESVLGFSNKWYADAVANAVWFELGDGVRAKVLTGRGGVKAITFRAPTSRTSSQSWMAVRDCWMRRGTPTRTSEAISRPS